ncbi:PHB depolymerase family esterase [Kitasatospora sp. NRRL B-11411]|uniref:extracellular catalytic domain type 1 short-chain-length polyhydroxyalkanoate depolymerase n=1 Tax=Kitasatospora sp. NRRL B-11411 TaxID=1463822 RepID=UPI0009DDBCE2|nr:PHB depolymerase family esterase [Kitasatospora sp. NRRL B-11411]
MALAGLAGLARAGRPARSGPARTGREPRRRRSGPGRWAGAALAGALIVGGLLTGAPQASAAGLGQVTGFGTNPGNLAMYSYVPTALPAGKPLVVALHGCTQTATDYYNNSGWAQLADRWGFAVVFPQTGSANNVLSCFSWFDSSKDTRGKGEALSVKQMVDKAVALYGSDPSRVYVTGLSAGAGMAADLLADYPDVFAGGSIASGLPAQCATTQSAASGCQNSSQNLTPAQWGDKVRASYPGYTGPWPRVAIWHGSSDSTVAPVNATELRDQWTNVWGIGQNASATRALPGNTTLSVYNDGTGRPAVQLYSISGMGHGLPVSPGSGTTNCGQSGAYFLNTICSSYYTGLFWGLDGATATASPSPSASPSSSPSSSPSPSPSPSPSASSSPSPSPSSSAPLGCWTDNNYNQVAAGRAHQSGGYAYANGSNQNMGLWNLFVTHTLKETSAGYFVVADSGCGA